MCRSIGRPAATRSPRTTSPAYEHPLVWVELGDDPPRYLVAGAERAGNLLELVVLAIEDGVLVLHGMTLRASTRREQFGDDR